jgi:hypothetical protein
MALATIGGRRGITWVEKVCPQCEIVFRVAKARRTQVKFCSKRCQFAWRSEHHSGRGNPNWRGGHCRGEYPYNWPEISRRVMERDGHRCMSRLCRHNTDRLVVHHIDFIKGNCHPANLVTVCTSCNTRANFRRGRWQNYYTLLLRRQHPDLFTCYDPLRDAAFAPKEPPSRRGSGHPLAKIVEADVAEIRRLRVGGVMQKDIAIRYGVSQATISNICKGKSWSHV